MITRRQVLANLFGGSVALAVADIWIPGERTIFLPSRTVKISSLVDVQFIMPLLATGDCLDRLTGLYHVFRKLGEPDAALRERALAEISRWTQKQQWHEDGVHYLSQELV